MLRGHIRELFKDYPSEIQTLVAQVLELEQRYISYELKTNNTQLKEIKQFVRHTIERIAGGQSMPNVDDAADGDNNEA